MQLQGALRNGTLITSEISQSSFKNISTGHNDMLLLQDSKFSQVTDLHMENLIGYSFLIIRSDVNLVRNLTIKGSKY